MIRLIATSAADVIAMGVCLLVIGIMAWFVWWEIRDRVDGISPGRGSIIAAVVVPLAWAAWRLGWLSAGGW